LVNGAALLAQGGVPGTVDAAWLIPAIPLFGAVLLMLLGRRFGRAAGAIATTLMFGAFGVGLATFFDVVSRPASDRTFVQTLWSWIAGGSFRVSADYRIDPLALVMILVVTGVGALIHLYSIGYMHGDPRYPRYFAYMNLFAFSMLVLVMANNFLVLYVGWELVGLCSYLLIGYWFERPTAATAAKKAFITNRVGDVSFAVGLFLIFATFGTLDFAAVFRTAPVIASGTATAIALLLFGGAIGKSAQIPLYVWLPDAMEGPTPVSALIHAATMVTAGIYMVARTHVIFEAGPVSLDVVAAIGAATAVFAAIIAVAQDDIKRILAYSTISQLGFMFTAVGVGAAAAGVFHLVTHAFFKALLFLGAGSVMHALSNKTDITRMGGLFRKIPWTAATFAFGWVAIIGVPLTSGFFSKDQILEGAYDGRKDWALVLLLLALTLTAFYMSRLVFLTFFGRSRLDSDEHPHESPPLMVLPLVLLGLAALLAGLLGPSAESGRLQRFIGPTVQRQSRIEASLSGAEQQPGTTVKGPFPEREGPLAGAALPGLSVGLTAAGVLAAGYMYLGPFDWRRRRERPSWAWRTVRNKFYVDEAYGFVFTSAGRLVASALAYVVDLRLIDGLVNAVGSWVSRLASAARRVQTGYVRTYGLAVLGGSIVLLGLLIGRTR
jgi:NADH-quinone oxidoreductase subunit L